MRKLRLISLLAIAMTALGTLAQGPNNTGTYYMNANGQKGAQLKTALWNIIKSPQVKSYSGLYDAYVQTDTRADGYVRDWYSNATNYRHNEDTGSYKKEGDSYNREHSVPQSWFNEASPMKSDIVHVIPTDGYVNNRRSNYPFGEVGSVDYQSKNGYSKLGSCKTAGYSGKVFEPNDEIKGDIARIYFYMATCYEDRINQWGGGIFNDGKYPGIVSWTLDMMMRWSKQDPVDAREVARNNAVYNVQSNRNPFVDYPGLEDYVWGNKKEMAFSYDQYDGTVIPDTIPDTKPDTIPDIKPDTIPDVAQSCTILLNNAFFGVSYTGPVASSEQSDFVGTQDGVTVVYSLGEGGSNRYCNSEQIRLYQMNTLTISVKRGTIAELEFLLAKDTSKKLQASTGIINELIWKGNASNIAFSVNDGSGNMALSGIKVGIAVEETEGIVEHVAVPQRHTITAHSLSGQRIAKPTRRGLYIRNGKKILVR
jgi:endonuclease I